MTALLLAALLSSSPVYPLNPVKQDTLSHMSLHFTAGLNGPGSVVSTGPEVTAKWEMTIVHPFVGRMAVDYRYGKVNSVVYPDGTLHRTTISLEALYYRGTDEMTGYLGGGVVYSVNSFSLGDDADSLLTNHGITGVDMNDVVGYRITVGLRIHSVYSIEIGMTDTRPSYVYTWRYSPTHYSEMKESYRSSDFRVSFGYLFNLKI